MDIKLIQFQSDNRKYRIVAKTINTIGDVEFYVEQYLYEDNIGNKIWIKIDIDSVNTNKMTLNECIEILKIISEYVNDYYLRY